VESTKIFQRLQFNKHLSLNHHYPTEVQLLYGIFTGERDGKFKSIEDYILWGNKSSVT